MRAPIFYDQNNTSYYVDPASTSILNALTLGGTISARFYSWYDNNVVDGGLLNTSPNSALLTKGSGVLGDGIFGDQLAFKAPNTAEFWNGSSWVSTTVLTDCFKGMNAFRFGATYVLNNSNQQRVRFTWSGFGYQFWDCLLIAGSTNGNSMSVIIESSTDGSTWVTKLSQTDIGGNWPGYQLVRNQSNNSGSNPWFRVTILNNFTNGNTIGIQNISLFGSYGGMQRLFDWDYSRNITFGGNITANIFYDGNDTAYYTDQAGTSNYNNLIINGTLRLPNNALVNVNNEPDVWGARFRTTTSTTYLGASLQNIIWCGGGAYEGFTTQGSGTGGAAFTARNDGICWARSSFRSPIFYDQDNTGYYFDGAGLSRFNQGDCVGRWYFYANRNTSSDSPPLQAYSDNGSGAIMSFHRGGYYAVNMGLDSDNVFRIGGWSAAVNRLQLDMSGNLYSASSMRSSVFYDQDDTGYYLDPNSTSASCLRVAGGIHVSVGNVTGQGIILADDGDIVDLNDGYCAMRFSYGVRIHSGNRTGGAVIALTNGGNIIANGNVTAYGSASDIRLKENIVPISNALSKVNSLTGYSFNYKGKHDRLIGVIAQETEKVLPEVVYDYENQETGEINKAVRYENMVALLIEAVKELKAELDSVKSRLH